MSQVGILRIQRRFSLDIVSNSGESFEKTRRRLSYEKSKAWKRNPSNSKEN